MKNIFTVTLISILAILFVTACSKAPKSPADTIQKPDQNVIQQQADFDQAMIEKNKN